MKHTVIAVLLFFAIIAGVTFNSRAVTSMIGGFLEKLEALPTDENGMTEFADGEADSLYDEWRRLRFIAALSTHMEEVERVDEALTDLCSYASVGDFSGYFAAAARAREAAEDLIKGEQLRAENIF